jgi:putative transcriptional regulator
MAPNQCFGAPISALRRRLQMTQEEFAHAIGVTVSTVNRWENGHIEPSRLARRAMEGLLSRVGVAPEMHDLSAAAAVADHP